MMLVRPWCCYVSRVGTVRVNLWRLPDHQWTQPPQFSQQRTSRITTSISSLDFLRVYQAGLLCRFLVHLFFNGVYGFCKLWCNVFPDTSSFNHKREVSPKHELPSVLKSFPGHCWWNLSQARSHFYLIIASLSPRHLAFSRDLLVLIINNTQKKTSHSIIKASLMPIMFASIQNVFQCKEVLTGEISLRTQGVLIGTTWNFDCRWNCRIRSK